MPVLVASWDEVADWLLTDGLRIAGIVLAAIAADFLLRRLAPPALRIAVDRRMEGRPGDEAVKRLNTLTAVTTGSGRAVIALVALFTILPLAGIDIAPLLASVGVAGIAIGFGAQSLVRDVIRGMYILIDGQFGAGDVVKVAGISGQVEDVGLRRTILRDLDGVVHYIPNSEITVASNFTQDYSRVNLNITVSYKQNLDQAIAIINRVGQELAGDPEWNALVLTPPSVLRVDNLGSAGIELKIVGDTQPTRQWEVMGELRKRLVQAFGREGVLLPTPPGD